jgi:hypothetical protein
MKVIIHSTRLCAVWKMDVWHGVVDAASRRQDREIPCLWDSRHHLPDSTRMARFLTLGVLILTHFLVEH